MASIALPYDPEETAADAADRTPVRQLSVAAPVVFLAPAYNERENVPRLLAELDTWAEGLPAGSRVVIVDDGSTDGTSDVILGYTGPLVVELVRFPRNQGPGAAFRAGFDAALASVGDDAFVVTLEADTTSDLGALPAMLACADAGADLVLAAWEMVDVSRFRRAMSEAAAFTVRRTLGVEARTVSSFFRVYRASTLRYAQQHYGANLIREPGFACKAELLAKLSDLGVRIDEVPVRLDTSRRVGESKMPVCRTILAYWRMMARQRLQRRGLAA